jgi:PmbA protein
VTEETLARLLALGDQVVAQARPGEQLEAVVVHGRETEVRAYDGEVESFTFSESDGIGIRVIVDGRQGFAHAGTFDPAMIAETLAEARDNATFATVDPALGLAEPDGVPVAELVLYDPALETFPVEAKVGLAIELERAVLAADSRIAGIESVDYVDAVSYGAVVSTTGIRIAGRDGGAYLSAYALAADGDETQTGYGWSIARDPRALDVAACAADAARRATRLLGAVKPRSGRCRVVLDPFVTAQLLGIVGSTLSGEAVLKGRSLFAERLGEAVAAPSITLVDDATDPAMFSATEADGEGLATRRNVLIAGGVLQQYLHNAYTARRLGTVSTGSAVRGYNSTPGVGCLALAIEPGSMSQAELLAHVGDGVLVQDVAGMHSGVNSVSGDFSTGIEGLAIRGGELAEPLREATMASTLQRLLLDISLIGADVDYLPMNAMGVSLVIDDITVSGS